jgi:DNA-binding transcriptional LysR family regulator
VALSVVEGAYGELAGPLRDGEIDLMLGALREGADAEGLRQEAVFADVPVLVMRKGHPLESAENPIPALGDYPWIMPSPGTPLRRLWQAMVEELGMPVPPVGIECGSVITIRELLRHGDGLTLLSPAQVAVEVEAGVLAQRALPVGFARRIGIITRADWRPATQAAFLAILREAGAG